MKCENIKILPESWSFKLVNCNKFSFFSGTEEFLGARLIFEKNKTKQNKQTNKQKKNMKPYLGDKLCCKRVTGNVVILLVFMPPFSIDAHPLSVCNVLDIEGFMYGVSNYTIRIKECRYSMVKSDNVPI